MRWLAFMALPLLSGCWIGPDFYADVPSEAPIAAGVYKIVRVEAMFLDERERLVYNEPVGARVRIAYKPNGDVKVSDRSGMEEADRMRLVAIDRERGLYAVDVDPGQGAVEIGSHVYGLVTLTPTGYRISVPLCDGTRRLKQGSPVVVRGLLFGLRCRYADRAAFETAMRAFADDPASYTEYARVG